MIKTKGLIMICVTDLRECSVASMIEDLFKKKILKPQENTTSGWWWCMCVYVRLCIAL